MKSNSGVVAVNHMDPLDYSPAKWDEIGIGYERDLSLTHGVIRNFGDLSLEFVKDGYDMLTHLMYNGNSEQTLYLLIQKFFSDVTDIDFGGVYKTVYKGLINLRSFRDESTKVLVAIGETGIRKDYNAKKDNTYEYNLTNSPEAVFLRNNGVEFYKTSNFIISAVSSNIFIPVTYVNSEGDSTSIVTSSQIGNSDDYFLKNTGKTPVAIDFVGEVAFKPQVNVQEVHVQLIKRSPSGDVTIREDDFDPVNSSTVYTVSYNYTGIDAITLNEGEGLFIRALVVAPVADSGRELDFQETTLKASYKTRYKPTYIPCFTPATVAGKLTASITGSRDNLAPSALLAANSTKLLFSGDAARGLPTAKFKTSLTSFFRSMHVIIGACMAIEHGKFVFEYYDHVYNFTGTAVPLGTVSNFSNDYAEELTGNALHIGFRDQTFDDVNGRADFVGTAKYSTPSSEEKTIELISDYDASPYAIEFARIKYSGKDSTDSGADNKIFVVDAIQQGLSFTANIYADNLGSTNFVADIYADNFGSQHIIFVTGNDPAAAAIPIGTPITLSNTVSNNGTYTVTNVAAVSGGVNVYVAEPLIPELTTGVTFFSAGNNIIFVSGDYEEAAAFIPGLKFTLSGSDLNNKTFTVKAVSPAGGGVNLYVLEPLVTELKDGVLFTVNNLYVPRRDAVVLEGVPSPATIFNVELSPSNLIRTVHKKFLNSIFYGFEGMKLEYRTTDKNRELKYVASDGVTVDEDADIVIGSDRWFINYFFGFDTLVPISLYETLENTPDAHFEFIARGVPLKGLLHKAGISLATNSPQQFSLYCSPEIDLKTLL